jgi:23S rRNA (cytidine1920-2'-O)/16S rRNA (cytidine1409-2'-O)-methyltransferase
MKQIPLLQLLRQRFPDVSGDKLYAHILCGEVTVSGERVLNPKHPVAPSAAIEISGQTFVSRGALKLEAALEKLDIDVRGLIFVDAGASTGGFTQVLLNRGASAVHTVDVGYNQLAYTLRTDPRVFVHERTNIMALKQLEPQPDAAVADLSFRSLRGAASHLLSLTRLGWALVLFKPQFEYGSTISASDDCNFQGVVKDQKEIDALLENLRSDLLEENVTISASVPSPVAGKKGGNREIMLLIKSII